MNRRQKIIVSVTGIFLVLLILVGLTYAYFLTRINGNTNSTSITLTTANLELTYYDGDEELEPYGVVSPGMDISFKNESNEEVQEKIFTVSNTGNDEITGYGVLIQDLKVYYLTSTGALGESTTLKSPSDFRITLECRSSIGEPCIGKAEIDNATLADIGAPIVVNSIKAGEVHTYSLKMYYKETGIDQSADMNKTFTAKVNISNNSETASVTFEVPNSSESDYAELHSVKQTNVGFFDSKTNTKTYVFTGVEPGVHTFTVKKSDDTQKFQKQIAIENGEILSTKTEEGIPTIIVGKTDRKVVVPISASNEVDLSGVTAETNVNELQGVTVNVLKASSGDKQVKGLKLYDSMDAAYNALQTYLGISFKEHSNVESGGYQIYTPSNIPKELIWTIYGEVTFDQNNANDPYPEGEEQRGKYHVLSGGLYAVWGPGSGNRLDAEPIEKISVIGGNSSASLTNTLTQNFGWHGNTKDFTMTVKFSNVQFNKTFTIKQFYDSTNLIFENCTFTKEPKIENWGDVTVKNNLFKFEDWFVTGYPTYYAMAIYNSTTDMSGNVLFENNVIDNVSRGLNIGSVGSDVIIRNNTFKNVKNPNLGALQLTAAKSILVENNRFDNILGNALYFHKTFNNAPVTIKNNTITNTNYLAQFGDNTQSLDHTGLNITSSGNSVSVEIAGKGISEQGNVTSNSFTLN